jgi:hypothetical protein
MPDQTETFEIKYFEIINLYRLCPGLEAHLFLNPIRHKASVFLGDSENCNISLGN